VPQRDVSKSGSQSLAKMMDLGAGGQGMWKPEELGAILEHQLSAPLELDLIGLQRPLVERLRVAREGNPPIQSFRDLLNHPLPPVDLLDAVKQFAKASRGCPDAPLPDEIATVFYFLSIVVALTKCGQRITHLDDQSLRHGLDWALGQSWLDDSTRRLFEAGRRSL